MLARGQTIEGIDEAQAAELVLDAGEFSLHHERMAHSSRPTRPTTGASASRSSIFRPMSDRPSDGAPPLLVRGQDRFGHWDPEILPRHDLDPEAFALLKSVWGQYKDGEVVQAAEAIE